MGNNHSASTHRPRGLLHDLSNTSTINGVTVFDPNTDPSNGADSSTPDTMCSSDADCMALDPYASTPSNLVYACPSGKCVAGQCSCGSGCSYDSRTGSCCQGFQTINGESDFCILNTAKPNIVPRTGKPKDLNWLLQNKRM
jgi:hypothetical protein